jgi:hypothetical protein
MSGKKECRMPVSMTHAAWRAEAVRRFGEDELEWAFVCPVCKHVAKVRDWKKAGAPVTAVAFSCVGRWMPDAKDAFSVPEGSGPCNYTGGGLFRLNPIGVEHEDGSVRHVFAFAEEGT